MATTVHAHAQHSQMSDEFEFSFPCECMRLASHTGYTANTATAAATAANALVATATPP